jgi:putative transposase
MRPSRLRAAARFSLLVWSRLCAWRNALVIVKPETPIGWHRKGFKLFWKWKSRPGRPRIPSRTSSGDRGNGWGKSDLRTSTHRP